MEGRPVRKETSNRKCCLIRKGAPELLLTLCFILVGVQVLVPTRLQFVGTSASHLRASWTQEWQQQPYNATNATTRKAGGDGTFSGMDVVYRSGNISETFFSSAHCIGENYQEAAWIHRSCHFSNLCFNVETHQFVLFQSSEQFELHQKINNHQYSSTSTAMSNRSVSIGGINIKWTREGFARMKWFPKMEKIEKIVTHGYYQLPSDVVWVPFHSMAAFNPGHLLWDDFLPIYTLLAIFQLLQKRLLLTKYMIGGERLWATCETRDANREACKQMLTKFLPLMGIRPNSFYESSHVSLNVTMPRSKYVCASNGAAGLGMLTDHGTKLHGWKSEDYKTIHNYGRGAMIYQFRNFMLRNIGLPIQPQRLTAPYKIVFSINSSKTGARRTSFTKQREAVLQRFSKDQIHVESYEMKTLSLKEQIKITMESSIYVSACGGGAATATFLPRGSAFFVYYAQEARLDFDLLNNIGYTRMHWLSTLRKDEIDEIEMFLGLVAHELNILDTQAE